MRKRENIVSALVGHISYKMCNRKTLPLNVPSEERSQTVNILCSRSKVETE